jgi:hypothetical protein
MIAYEQRLGGNLNWALREGSLYFDKESAVHKTLRDVTRRLDELGVYYNVVGALALFFHGVRRFTEDVDILVTRDGLTVIHEQLEGRGYLPLFSGSKNLRDTETGVRIEFLVAGEYPGDGRPKAVAFPDPADTGIEIEGIRFLQLLPLIELKLASGTTNPRRGQDLVDVQRMIETLNLPEELADRLELSVRDKYREIWTIIHTNPP